MSFEVEQGEVFGFLGPNGAGKTTTMKIITCYMPPTSGKVSVEDLDIAEYSLQVRKKIGYLPEMNPLYMDMNVIDYLDYAARLHRMNDSLVKGRIREMVEVCGLTTVRHKDIGELSKGFRQRVGLAQAMIHDPDVLILDEPTSGLDPNQIVEIRNLIKHLGRAKTVILSTHILTEVQATCNRVIIINEGKIVADGTTDELQERFRGGELLTLDIKVNVENAMTDLFPKLKAFPQVTTLDYQPLDESIHRFTMNLPKGTDIREELFRLAVNERWVILEMHREEASLEEIFHKLTLGGN